MDLIKHSTAVPSKPAPVSTGTAGWAIQSSGTTGTIVTADTINGILAELKNLIEGAGLTLDINDDTLVKQAVQILGTIPGITYDSGSGGTITITAANFVAALTDLGLTHVNNLYVDPPTGNPSITVGKTDNSGISTTPFIDFKSKNQSATSDVRMIASGGTVGTDYQGSLQILADAVTKWTDGVVTTFDNFPSNTHLVFYQNAAPPGWTNIGWGANYTLVSGVGGTFGGGGGAGHNIITGCNVVASHTHTVNPGRVTSGNENQAHNHNVQDAFYPETSGTLGGINGTTVISRGFTGLGSNGTDNNNNALLVRNIVSGTANQPHNHYVDIPSTTSSTNTNLDIWQPIWVSVICCRKN